MAPKPTIIAVGTYHTLEAADAAADRIMALHHDGALGHVATAVVTRGALGDLEIHRRDTTARHLAWGGAIIGATLGILIPPLGAAAVAGGAGVLATSAVIDAAVLAGVGGAMGHLWKQIPKRDVRELGDLLDTCDSAIVAVAIEKQAADVEGALSDALSTCIKHVSDGDIEGAFHAAAQSVTAGGAS